MPTYDYRCNNCGHEFELFQQMSAGVKKKCPECGQLKLERLIGTGAGVIFKGGGFYETDYRSDSYRKAAEAERKAKTGDADGKKDKSKTDSKAAKSESSTKKSDSSTSKSPNGKKAPTKSD
ncbi:MAG: FmdB family zinc ribbon protein [Planctomycetota bacterium]|jgi:putative FmdB family regulatory protein